MLLGLALVAVPARASAVEEVAFRLDYKPVPGCMKLDTLALFLEGDFGYRVVHDDARALVRITVKGSGRKMEAHVSALDDAGIERWQAVVPGPIDCRELMQDTAYAISLNLGKWELKKQAVPAWLLRRPTIEVGSPAPSPPMRTFAAFDDGGPLRVRTPDPLYATATTTTEPAAGPRWELGGAALFVPYGLPRVGFGGSAAVSVTWTRFSLGGEVRALASLAQERIDPERTLLLSGLVVPCLETSWSLAACAAVSIGRTTYLGENATYAENRALAISLGPRLAYNIKISERFRLRPFAETLFAIGENPLTIKLLNGETRVLQPLAPLLVHAGVAVLIDVQ